MGTSTIPVDLLNPGQVLACMGFLEAAEQLYGNARSGFQWESDHDTAVSFVLDAQTEDPVSQVLEFLAGSEIHESAPDRWTPNKGEMAAIARSGDCFPGDEPNQTSLPIILSNQESAVQLGHWTDGTNRDEFKLYSGNRSAFSIASSQIHGTVQANGKVTVPGVAQLLESDGEALARDPFGVVVPMKGSFNMDARCAWSAIDAGYSPNEHDQKVMGSPVVEIMAAWGLENARPGLLGRRYYRYGVWRGALSPLLARPMLSGGFGAFECRLFTFRLDMSGKNKIVQYAEEEKG